MFSGFYLLKFSIQITPYTNGNTSAQSGTAKKRKKHRERKKKSSHGQQKGKRKKKLPYQVSNSVEELLLLTSQRDANDQKFKRKHGETLNQLIKAMAVAVSNLAQWF